MQVICQYCQSPIRSIPETGAEKERISHGVCADCLPRLVRDYGYSLQEFLDVLSAPVLVMQNQGRVLAANQAALTKLDKSQIEISGELTGDVIGCVHAREPGGCTRTVHCQSCVIRSTVARTHETGEPCLGVPAFADVGILSGDERVEFLISTRKQDDVVVLEIVDADESDEPCLTVDSAREIRG